MSEKNQKCERELQISGMYLQNQKRNYVSYIFLDVLQVNTAKIIAILQTEIKFGTNGLGDRTTKLRYFRG